MARKVIVYSIGAGVTSGIERRVHQGWRFLKADLDPEKKNGILIYFEVNTDNAREDVFFNIYGTGAYVDPDQLYLGTVTGKDGFGRHIFALTNEDKPAEAKNVETPKKEETGEEAFYYHLSSPQTGPMPILEGRCGEVGILTLLDRFTKLGPIGINSFFKSLHKNGTCHSHNTMDNIDYKLQVSKPA